MRERPVAIEASRWARVALAALILGLAPSVPLAAAVTTGDCAGIDGVLTSDFTCTGDVNFTSTTTLSQVSYTVNGNVTVSALVGIGAFGDGALRVKPVTGVPGSGALVIPWGGALVVHPGNGVAYVIEAETLTVNAGGSISANSGGWNAG